MIDAERFAYSQVSDDFGATSLSPYLPLTLSYKNNNIDCHRDNSTIFTRALSFRLDTSGKCTLDFRASQFFSRI